MNSIGMSYVDNVGEDAVSDAIDDIDSWEEDGCT